MRPAWDRIVVILLSAAAWALVLLAGPHLAHALRGPMRQIAHAGQDRRRSFG